MHKADIVSVATQFRYTTMIELPAQEEIMDATCGDKDFWAVNYQRNFAFVKPLGDKPGGHTNINLITTSGNVYSLVVREVSKEPAARADLKIFLEQGDEGGIAAMKDKPQYVRADQVEAIKQQRDEARAQLATVSANSATKEAEHIRHDYTWKHDKVAERFGLKSIYRDDRFTYLALDAQEAPTLYEIANGKPVLTNYTLQNGVYVVPKVLDQGFLQLGKERLSFSRDGRS